MAINVSVADIEVSETAGTATFTVNLSGDAQVSDLILNWATSNNASSTAALPGSDYVAASGTLTIPVGQTTGIITVNVLDDLLAEGLEFFFITLTAPNPPVGQEVVIPGSRGYTAYAGILDDEPSVTALDTVVDESAGTVSVTFQLSRPWTSSVSVDYQTTTATATDVVPAATLSNPTPVSDFVAASGTVTFAPGETVKTVSFTINNDTLVEGREIFAVSLSNPVNASLNESDSRAHIVIEDNDATAVATPTVNVFGGVVVEGQHAGVMFTPSGATGTASSAVEFLVMLSAPDTGTVTMNYSTVNGSAVAGTDYTATSGVLTFQPGEVAKKILVPIIDNTTAQDALTRSFSLTVSGISGATGGITSSNGTIVDNENASLPTRDNPLVITAASVGDIIGTAFHDSLVGSSGNDILDGRAKPDTMVGGAGDDIYIFEDSGGSVTEYFNEGTDTVITYLNNSQLGTYFERLYIGGNTGLQAVGNSSTIGNLMVGNIGNDTIYAWGGDDTVYGGVGDDSLYGDSTGDITLTGADLIYGEAGNDTLSGGDGNDTLDGGDGNDHLIGELSAAEDTIGTMTGNDSLIGGAGNDTLDGGRGTDTMVGGVGDDAYYVDNVGDVVIETAGEGSDIIFTAINYTLAENLDVETVALTGSATRLIGNSADNVLMGGDLGDTLSGGQGNDTLQGGGGDDILIGSVGDDVMAGGEGNDIYFIDAAGDVVVETEGAGSDKIYTTINYVLTGDVHVETLFLRETATELTGNDRANILVGGSLNDSLMGAGGDDTLQGAVGNDTLDGGSGNDSLAGGAGDDVYYVDSALDVVTELAGSGSDTVYASVNYTLRASSEVETLVLVGDARNLTGNNLANTLIGSEGDDSLNGGAGNDTLQGGSGNDTLNGGAGGDRLEGGAGDDTYAVDSASDVVLEAEAGGFDRIYTTANYLLANGSEVEALYLSGTTATQLTGNEFSNTLVGSSRADRLNGAAGNDTLIGGEGADTLDGGAGSDSMAGGGGDDVYVVDSADDIVTELAGGGADKLYAYVDYSLRAGSEVESLFLRGTATQLSGNEKANALIGGSLDDRLSGGAGNDTLQGGDGADTLVGGAGSDRLTGGTGDDVFVFDSALNATNNVDWVTDWNSADLISLDNDVFTSLGAAGALSAGQFYSGAGVTVAQAGQSAGVYYDSSTGNLYYDADGFGGAVSVKFALIGGAPVLSASNFAVQD